MRDGVYYLNNSGHRWVIIENGKRAKITLHTKSGKEVTRSVIYYEAFGNFATARICYKSKRISVFFDTVLEN